MRRKKIHQVKPGRTDAWWQNLINDRLPPKEWKKNLRLTKADFMKLVDLIKPHAKERSSRTRQDVLSLKRE